MPALVENCFVQRWKSIFVNPLFDGWLTHIARSTIRSEGNRRKYLSGFTAPFWVYQSSAGYFGVKMNKFLRAFVGFLIAGLFSATSAYAALPTFPSSGTCAMLITKPVPYGATVPFNDTYNILAVLNFTSATAGTISYNSVHANYTTAGLTIGTPVSGTAVAFAVSAASAPSGAQTISFTLPAGAGTSTWNSVAVNGGNTLLIQGANEALSGVCQF